MEKQDRRGGSQYSDLDVIFNYNGFRQNATLLSIAPVTAESCLVTVKAATNSAKKTIELQVPAEAAQRVYDHVTKFNKRFNIYNVKTFEKSYREKTNEFSEFAV